MLMRAVRTANTMYLRMESLLGDFSEEAASHRPDVALTCRYSSQCRGPRKQEAGGVRGQKGVRGAN